MLECFYLLTAAVHADCDLSRTGAGAGTKVGEGRVENVLGR